MNQSVKGKRKSTRVARATKRPRGDSVRNKSAASRGNTAKPNASKLGTLTALLQQPKGASLAELCKATGWQAHSVRGAISGALKKKRGFKVISAEVDGIRTYRIA